MDLQSKKALRNHFIQTNCSQGSVTQVCHLIPYVFENTCPAIQVFNKRSLREALYVLIKLETLIKSTSTGDYRDRVMSICVERNMSKTWIRCRTNGRLGHGPLSRLHAPGMPGTFSPPPTSKETAS